VCVWFTASGVPHGYQIEALHGFIEELVVNDDPEHQWIDKIRSMRASNEARQMQFSKLSGKFLVNYTVRCLVRMGVRTGIQPVKKIHSSSLQRLFLTKPLQHANWCYAQKNVYAYPVIRLLDALLLQLKFYPSTTLAAAHPQHTVSQHLLSDRWKD